LSRIGRAAAVGAVDPYGPDSRHAWMRLGVALALMTLGASGMYVVSVVLPAIQADFGVDRSAASMPYTVTMIGFGIGGMVMGRLADRYGVALPSAIGAVGLGLGFVLAGWAPGLLFFGLAQGVLIGLVGTSAGFSPLVADTTLWFDRRRGIAVAICASGNYLGGALWPPIAQHFIETVGWRTTYVGIGLFCTAAMLPLALLLRRRPPALAAAGAPASGRPVAAAGVDFARPLGMTPDALQGLLVVAGVACCVAMAMPQVHIVAYCVDLGYGAARGAQMLALMLGAGIVSRLVSGVIADRIGGLRTLLLGSVLQGVALLLFLPFDAMVPLYLVSALFGLFQGGIVPSYALVVREHFPPQQAGRRVGVVITATLFGMALGGWMSGQIFDWTGSYRAAFVNGIGWNLLNVAIAVFLLRRAGPLAPRAVPAGATV
jgi:MFS family permease